MSEVRLPKTLADEMIEHLLRERPNEGCGILASQDGEVVKVFRMTNADQSPVRYSLVPDEQLAVENKIYDEGWELAGVYHSHTRTEAYPSPTDVRKARDAVPYVIVSLAEEPPAIRAFHIVKQDWRDEAGEIEEVPVVLDG